MGSGKGQSKRVNAKLKANSSVIGLGQTNTYENGLIDKNGLIAEKGLLYTLSLDDGDKQFNKFVKAFRKNAPSIEIRLNPDSKSSMLLIEGYDLGSINFKDVNIDGSYFYNCDLSKVKWNGSLQKIVRRGVVVDCCKIRKGLSTGAGLPYPDGNAPFHAGCYFRKNLDDPFYSFSAGWRGESHELRKNIFPSLTNKSHTDIINNLNYSLNPNGIISARPTGLPQKNSRNNESTITVNGQNIELTDDEISNLLKSRRVSKEGATKKPIKGDVNF